MSSTCSRAKSRLLARVARFAILPLSLLVASFAPKACGNPAQSALFFYYDYFKSDDGSPRDPTLNAMLANGITSEVAFGGNEGNLPDSFGTGASTSVRLCPVQQDGCGASDSFTTANVLRYLANVSTYVHVDEMRANQLQCEEDCATVVRNVAAAGYGGRIIFFFRFAPGDTANLGIQAALLQTAAEGLLRKIFFEVPIVACLFLRSFSSFC